MNIEALIAANTAALIANTEALNAILAQSGTAQTGNTQSGTAPAAPAEVVKKTRTAKAPAAPTGDTQSETTATETAETPAPEWDRDTYLLNITEVVKAAFTAAGPNLQAKKDEYSAIREKFNVTKASELTDEQLVPFYAAVRAL